MAKTKSARSPGARARPRKTAGTKVAARKRHESALQGAVRESTAGARTAVAVVRDAASSIVRAGLHEMEVVAQATREALRRFLASADGATKSTARAARKRTGSAARRKAGKNARTAKASATTAFNRAVDKAARAARKRVRSLLA